MGSDKALMRVNGGPMVVCELANALATCCDEVLLVGGDPARFVDMDLRARWVPDAAEGVGPLGGILGALAAARNEACLVVACDMPFITSELLSAMAAQTRDYRALAYQAEDLEPLLAIYARACVEPLRAAIASGQLEARRFLRQIGAQAVAAQVLDAVDRERRAATNVNTPEELAALQGQPL